MDIMNSNSEEITRSQLQFLLDEDRTLAVLLGTRKVEKLIFCPLTKQFKFIYTI